MSMVAAFGVVTNTEKPTICRSLGLRDQLRLALRFLTLTKTASGQGYAQICHRAGIPGAGNLTEAQLREVSQKSVKVLNGLGPEIQWLHSYVTGDKVYCVYLAPDEATIKEHAKRVGLPANRVSAVRRLLDASSAESIA